MKRLPKLFLFALSLLLMQLVSLQPVLAKEHDEAVVASDAGVKKWTKELDASYQKQLESRPDDARIRYEYGSLLSLQGSKAFSLKAVKYFQEAVYIEPSNKMFNAALGRELVKNKRYHEAIGPLQMAGMNSLKLPIDAYEESAKVNQVREYNRRLKSKLETQAQ